VCQMLRKEPIKGLTKATINDAFRPYMENEKDLIA